MHSEFYYLTRLLNIELFIIIICKHWGDPDIDGRIILRWIFGKWEEVETGWSWLRIGTDGRHL